MKRIFAVSALVLSLGYLVPLFPLPWTGSGGQTEMSFLQVTWIWGLGLLVFNVAGSVFLLKLNKGWILYALVFCIAQVFIWWCLSGLFVTNSDLAQFLSLKGRAIWELLQYPDFKVRFVTFHQDILVGAFYHVSMLWFAAQLFLPAHNMEKHGT
jgi:hypothetical protein